MPFLDGTKQCQGNRQEGLNGILILVIVGLVVFILGVLLLALASGMSGGDASSSGIVIFVGPFPIVFGSGPRAGWLILFSILLAALSILIFYLTRRKVQRVGVYSTSSSLP